ncbi:MAG: M20/M25/M40 family metallo-hydrolase [Chloroflexota bacterium]
MRNKQRDKIMTQEKSSAPRIAAAQIRLLERLSNACAVSGDEGALRQVVLEQVRSAADDVIVDALGNVLVTCRGQGKDRPRVMVAAHMDEVGFLLTHKENEGIFHFDTVGRIDARQLVGKPVLVGSEQIPGVIGVKPVHLTEIEERSKVISIKSLRIDIGLGKDSKVKVGDRATFATRFFRLGRNLCGKAFDDRIGVATLIELVTHAPTNIDLLAAFTVQEEIGLRGARVAAYTFDPDLAFVLDCTPAFDLPSWDGEENTRYNTRLGAGPAIYIADGGTISDPRLIQLLVRTAEEEGIPYQFRQPGGGGTDAGAIQRQRAGIPSVSISVPGRYLHTPVSLVRLEDWKQTLNLVYAALRRITSKTLT